MRPLVVGIGNPLLGDDAVGLEAARRIAEARDDVEVVDAVGTGFELLDLIEGRSHVLLLDAFMSGTAPLGALHFFDRDDFRHAVAPGPHYAGLPEALEMAEILGLPLPQELRALAVEIEDKYEFQEGLDPVIAQALPHMVRAAQILLDSWTKEVTVCTNTA